MIAEARRFWTWVGLAAVLWVSACSSNPAQPTTPSARPGTPGKPPAVAQGLAPVRLDALAAGRREPSDTARNPFRFQPRVVAAPAAARPPAPVSNPADARPAASIPPGPPALPPIPLKFIGVVQRANGVKWAVLTDNRLTVYGREGDIIDGQYRILAIGAESIELVYADGRGRQTVKLTGQ